MVALIPISAWWGQRVRANPATLAKIVIAGPMPIPPRLYGRAGGRGTRLRNYPRPGGPCRGAQAVKYVRRMEGMVEAPITLVSTSPERDDTIMVRDPFEG